MELAEGRLSSQTLEKISNLCEAITKSTGLLVRWGHHQEASAILKQMGAICRTIGEGLSGSEHQRYILKVWA